MKQIYFLVAAVGLLFLQNNADAQITTQDAAVMITSQVDTLKPSITLTWDVNSLASRYLVYRKTKNARDWGAPVASLPDSIQQYVDSTNVVVDSVYEYWVHRNTDSADLHSDGYIYVSVKLHPAEYFGKVILLVDSTYRDSFALELTRLKFDLIGDGWVVIRHDVSPTDSTLKIRNLIKSDYNADTANVVSVFIFGHVPVIYSGDINPDGHPNHLGAWPADGIYGDMTGSYTDTAHYDTAGIILANQNTAGDGKYDQSLFAGYVQLEVGRVDLSNMDSFALSEPALLKQYLNKDHAFRQKQFTPIAQAIISDNFGPFFDPDLDNYEAFASCGWRDFTPLLGTNHVSAGDYFSSVAAESYLWSYGCGGGNPLGAGGVGSTSNFAHDTVKTVFTMLFGSYFGDWGFDNDFLRAPLASQPMALSCCWSGRPYWHFHFTGSGETLGFCARWAQNNSGTYSYNYGNNQVHIALMGDPTLTTRIVAPAANLKVQATDSSKEVAMHWSPSPDTLRGYYVYRSATLNSRYTRIAILPAKDTSFVDSLPLVGNDYYMVRVEALESTASGYYFNLSEGVFDSVANIVSGIEQVTINNNQVTVYPNPANSQLTITGSQVAIDKIEIANILGQTVLVYTPGYNTPGSTIQLDVSALAQGTYFVTITADNKNVTRKVTVVR